MRDVNEKTEQSMNEVRSIVDDLSPDRKVEFLLDILESYIADYWRSIIEVDNFTAKPKKEKELDIEVVTIPVKKIPCKFEFDHIMNEEEREEVGGYFDNPHSEYFKGIGKED